MHTDESSESFLKKNPRDKRKRWGKRINLLNLFKNSLKKRSEYWYLSTTDKKRKKKTSWSTKILRKVFWKNQPFLDKKLVTADKKLCMPKTKTTNEKLF